MNKVWYIEIDGKREGPFTIAELKVDRRLTPDTWVWKAGFDRWKRIRDVPELKEVFVDAEDIDQPKEPEDGKKTVPAQDELVLEAGLEPPYLFWVLLAAIVIIYVLTQLYWKT